jgi:flagellar L-ring protein precursor FlgH
MRTLLLSTLFLLGSCSSYVQSLHNQIDREEMAQKQARQKRYYDPYGAYRGVPVGKNDARPIDNPLTLGNMPSTANTRDLTPESAKEYGKKRVQSDDLKDNDNSGSLWSGKNSESYLFVTNNIKRSGDIVVIEVLKQLKTQITDELKTAFPERRMPTKNAKGATTPEAKAEAPAAPTPATPQGQDEKEKVYDKISTQVVEEVNKDYLLVRGRKELIYQKAKRYIEFQALVSRKDISDNDTVKSNKVLETKIMVLRY